MGGGEKDCSRARPVANSNVCVWDVLCEGRMNENIPGPSACIILVFPSHGHSSSPPFRAHPLCIHCSMHSPFHSLLRCLCFIGLPLHPEQSSEIHTVSEPPSSPCMASPAHVVPQKNSSHRGEQRKRPIETAYTAAATTIPTYGDSRSATADSSRCGW